MGIMRWFSSCSTETSSRVGNPDPRRFEILRIVGFVGSGTAVEVRYPDAKNYEGRKILVYRCSAKVIEEQKVLDPHFCDDSSHPSPFARFEPTKDGWEAAMRLAKSL